ncbi:MarR family winged helix-turn-helix transcriptional regulator [uncultured Pseudokineococcus sp.]|uniref:MarR family winged helix-turn-helix transcriptional regulator n=1 Tax=uncultured Pseudokineococcus sp. TaxID=1642928 RepID=UPI0026392118|nr:MarR family winged helix-turn-helix transcriptional regulator [uncultured Pseudokineococcus sp.]
MDEDQTSGGETGGDPAPDGHEQAVAALETQVGLLVRRARAFSTSVATEVHPDLDHSAYGIMLRLATVGAERTTDLATFLGVGKPTTSRQLSQLVELGLVERTSDPTDGRASLVRLTPEGQQRFGRVRDDRRATLRVMLGPWADDDVLALAQLLERFNDLWATKPDQQQG